MDILHKVLAIMDQLGMQLNLGNEIYGRSRVQQFIVGASGAMGAGETPFGVSAMDGIVQVRACHSLAHERTTPCKVQHVQQTRSLTPERRRSFGRRLS